MTVESYSLAQVLLNVSKDKTVKKPLESFMAFLDRNNLMMFLPQINEHLKRSAQKEENDLVLNIVSRFDLNAAELKKIKSITKVGAKDPVVVTVDETMVGGFQATHAGKIYDGSLETQITRLKETLNA